MHLGGATGETVVTELEQQPAGGFNPIIEYIK